MRGERCVADAWRRRLVADTFPRRRRATELGIAEIGCRSLDRVEQPVVMLAVGRRQRAMQGRAASPTISSKKLSSRSARPYSPGAETFSSRRAAIDGGKADSTRPGQGGQERARRRSRRGVRRARRLARTDGERQFSRASPAWSEPRPCRLRGTGGGRRPRRWPSIATMGMRRRPSASCRSDLAGRRDAVHDGHLHIHEDEVKTASPARLTPSAPLQAISTS